MGTPIHSKRTSMKKLNFSSIKVLLVAVAEVVREDGYAEATTSMIEVYRVGSYVILA